MKDINWILPLGIGFIIGLAAKTLDVHIQPKELVEHVPCLAPWNGDLSVACLPKGHGITCADKWLKRIMEREQKDFVRDAMKFDGTCTTNYQITLNEGGDDGRKEHGTEASD